MTQYCYCSWGQREKRDILTPLCGIWLKQRPGSAFRLLLGKWLMHLGIQRGDLSQSSGSHWYTGAWWDKRLSHPTYKPTTTRRVWSAYVLEIYWRADLPGSGQHQVLLSPSPLILASVAVFSVWCTAVPTVCPVKPMVPILPPSKKCPLPLPQKRTYKGWPGPPSYLIFHLPKRCYEC